MRHPIARRAAPRPAAALAALLTLAACEGGGGGGGLASRCEPFEPLNQCISEPSDGFQNEIRVD